MDHAPHMAGEADTTLFAVIFIDQLADQKVRSFFDFFQDLFATNSEENCKSFGDGVFFVRPYFRKNPQKRKNRSSPPLPDVDERDSKISALRLELVGLPMNVMRFLAASFMTLSMFGCCCGRNVVMDPCDPCGGMMPACGPRFFSFPRFGGWHSCGACSSCGCGDVIMDGGSCGGGGCASCGGGGETYSTYSTPSGGSSCGCGASAAPSMLPMGTPSPASPPVPMTLPANSGNPEPPPVPPTESTTMMIPPSPAMSVSQKPLSSAPPQTVSYEEFQRLPGTIISGPGAVASAPPAPFNMGIQQTASVQPFLAPPPTNVSKAVPAQNRQAVWIPAKPN